MVGRGLLKGLGITLRHTFEKDITIQYPEQPPHLEDRFRGCLNFDYKNCIVCGLCVKACPNNVLSFETAQVEGSKKKRLVRYTIDLQYCLFCNLCVEACPKSTLFFVHDFELATHQRDQIKIVYDVPVDTEADMPADGADAVQIIPAAAFEAPVAEDLPAGEAKRIKLLGAMRAALLKNPQKALKTVLASEEDIAILAPLLAADEKKLAKLAELMIDDKEKAGKAAQALVARARKNQSQGGGEE